MWAQRLLARSSPSAQRFARPRGTNAHAALTPQIDRWRFGMHDLHRRDMPDVARIVADRSIGAEPPHGRDVQNGGARPIIRVFPGPSDAALALDVGAKIRKHKE